MRIQKQQKSSPTTYPDENILVVKRTHLFSDKHWKGFKKDTLDTYLPIINDTKEFLPRTRMETDPTYKQIIPYLIFTYDNKFFLMQRRAQASEQRLKNKFTLGIGGHIRQNDMESAATIFDWAQREFYEEIEYKGNLTIEPLGIVNDDTIEVGMMHVGLVLLLQGNSDAITIKSELHQGWLATLEECNMHYDTMETWSQLIIPFLEGK